MSAFASFDSEKIQECASWLQDCTAIFNGPKLYQHDVAVYLKAVCCPDPDKVIEALKHWLTNERHFPSPVDIRLRIRQIDESKKHHEEAKDYIMLESTALDDGKNRECARLLRRCADLYGTPHLSDPDITAYFNALNCTDTDKIYQALWDWCGREIRFPLPEDIRSRIRKLDENKGHPGAGGARPIRSVCAPRLLSASWKFGTANSEGLHPHAVHGADAHQAATESVEKSDLPSSLDKDASQ